MAKLTLQTLLAKFSSITKINANNTAIEAAIENTLSRDGTAPNAMAATLDMNSNKVTNLPTALTATEPARFDQVQTLIANAGFEWKGPWLTATSYVLNEIVSNNGAAYICISIHTSASTDEPGVGVNEATFWDLITAKGDTGATGATGTAGSGTGGWSLESTTTVAAVASMNVPLPASSLLRLECVFKPVTDAVLLDAQVTLDNFSTLRTGVSDYMWNASRFRAGVINSAFDAADSSMTFNQTGMGNDANGYYDITFLVRGHSDASASTSFDGKGIVSEIDALFGQMITYGTFIGATTVVDGIQFSFSSGNIASATVRVYSLIV